jgi:hypothetical protein
LWNNQLAQAKLNSGDDPTAKSDFRGDFAGSSGGFTKQLNQLC